LVGSNNFSTTTQWANVQGNLLQVPDAISDPGTIIKIRLNNTLSVQNGGGNLVKLHDDYIQLTIYYRWPAYHINNFDLMVPEIVYLRPGMGSYYLIDMSPDWEIVRKDQPATTITTDSGHTISAFPSFWERWRQDNGVWEDQEFVYMFDANGP
jgi:hypothetical protein